MGDFYEHVMFGLFFSILVLLVFESRVNLGLVDALVGIMFVIAGSVLPDIDNTNSYVYRATQSTVSITLGVAVFLSLNSPLSRKFLSGLLATVSLFAFLSVLDIKHRGLTHTWSFAVTLTGAVVVAGVLFLGSIIPGMALGTGLFSHLLLDWEFQL